ncbi:MAG: hypothetical protein JWM11_4074 [Planctomycetaceae bacterium]|nr:hypothetical protein [Planctomycetaceae bacterium]
MTRGFIPTFVFEVMPCGNTQTAAIASDILPIYASSVMPAMHYDDC